MSRTYCQMHRKDKYSQHSSIFQPVLAKWSSDRLRTKWLRVRVPFQSLKSISKCLNINNLINPLQFGFRQKYSTTHAVINLTESIRHTLDESCLGCVIFIDFADLYTCIFNKHLILVIIKSYCVDWSIIICGVCNKELKPYLSDRKQFVSINELMPINAN